MTFSREIQDQKKTKQKKKNAYSEITENDQ